MAVVEQAVPLMLPPQATCGASPSPCSPQPVFHNSMLQVRSSSEAAAASQPRTPPPASARAAGSLASRGNVDGQALASDPVLSYIRTVVAVNSRVSGRLVSRL